MSELISARTATGRNVSVLANEDGSLFTSSHLLLLSPKGYRRAELTTDEAGAPDIPEGATLAVVSVEAQGVRYRDDGIDPTPVIGMPLSPGDSLVYDAVMNNVRVIAQQDGAILNISFYGPQNGSQT